MKRRTLARNVLFGGLAFAAAEAQTSPSPAVPPSATGEVIELSPFLVDASKDRGYQAENTLAGSRLNTNLRDTPASLTVFTKELLEDLGLNQIENLIDYSVGSQINLQDTNAAPNANNYLGGPNVVKRIDVRGIRSSQGLDYYKSITVDDSYRIDRYDESRGPNGILFGVGDAGGLINQSSILASTNRDSGRIAYQTGNYGTNRSELRFNKVFVPKILGFAVAGVHQENGGWRKPTFYDKDRAYGTITFSPTSKITFRVMGERGREKRTVLAPFGAFDGAMAWLDNRKALGANAVTFTPNNQVPTAAQIALGVISRNTATGSNTRRFIYVDNDGTFFNSAGTFLTGSYNNPAVRAPDGTPGVSGATLSINDPSFLPYNVNSGGPGMYRDQYLTNYTISMDWALTSSLNLNVGYNYQETHYENPLIKGTQPMISGEANRTFGVNGPANPYAGQLYIDATWYHDLHRASSKEARASLSYDLKTKWEWLGQHRFAGMFSRNTLNDMYNAQRLGLLGAPFNADPLNTNNLVVQRVYLDEKSPASFVAPDWHRVPATVMAGTTTYNVGWLNGAAGTTNSEARQTLDTKLLVAQSRFLNKRLVTTVGYREDEADVTSFGYSKDPVLKTDVIDRDPAKATVNQIKGITRTQGAVLHVTDWLSLLANNSTNIGVPTFTDKVFPNGTIAPPPKGRGQDYGAALDLFSGRLSLKAVAFTTAQEGQTGSGGILARYNNRNVAIADALQSVLVGPGLAISATDWAPQRTAMTPPVNAALFDEESKGYEFSVIANLTRNWRLTASCSYTDRLRSNSSGRDAIPWYGFTYDGKLIKQGIAQNANGSWTIDPSAFTPDGTVAKWIALGNRAPAANLTTLMTSDQITVAQEIRDIINDINDDKIQNEQKWGLSPGKASMFTAYDFTEGRLKGFTAGLGFRWRGAALVGWDASGKQISGRPFSQADLMLRYRVKPRRLGSLSFQLNVTNLFDQSGIIPKRFAAASDWVVPGGRGIGYSRFDLMDPRSIRLTTTLSF